MQMKKWLALLVSILLFCGALPGVQVQAADMPLEVRNRFTREVFTDPDTGLTLPYRMYVPERMNAERKYSFLLFLHGAGERGSDNERHITVNSNILTRIVNDTDPDHACIILAPQCPSDRQWVDTPWGNGSYSVDAVPQSQQMSAVMKIVEQVTEEYKVDPDRMYITGISMGGYGTWDTIIRYPDTFAAAIPVCGAGDPTKASLIKDIPIRTYHSSDDGTVPVRGTREMVAALEEVGGKVQYTEYTNAGHGAWEPAYNDADLVDWLFEQRQAPSIQSVDQPEGVNVLMGTEFEELPLPETVKVTLSNGRRVDAAVTWASTSADGVPYDGYTKGGYTLTGALAVEGAVNPDGLTAEIHVEVLEAPAIIPGDLDDDGEVTIADVMEACKVMARESAGTDPTDDEIERGDLDSDGEITIADVMEICKILARQG